MGMSKTSLARVISACTWGLPDQVRSILAKYSATMLLPGVSGAMRFGYQPGNYRESTGQTLAAADQQVGLVVDAAGALGPELTSSVNFANPSTWDMANTASFTASTWSMGSSGGPMLVTVPGKTYSVSFPWSATASGTFVLYNGSDISAPIVAQQSGTSGTLTLIFTAAATRAYFRFGAGGTVTAGAISVRELPGIHASQSTSGFQPVLRNTSGIQSWQFDGTDDRLSLSAVPFQMADDHFVVIGATRGGTGIVRRLFHVGSAGDVPRVAVLSFSSNGTPEIGYRNDAGTLIAVSGSAPVGTAPVVISATSIATALRLRADSALLATGTRPTGATTLTAATVGAHTVGAAYFNGHIHGVIFGKGAISDSELLTLERFVASLQGRTL